MADEFQVAGANAKALFTLKVHRGDGMALLAMNWRTGRRRTTSSASRSSTESRTATASTR